MVTSLSCVQLFATPWTIAHQTPLSIEFSRQEYWSWLPFLCPGHLPYPGIKPRSPPLQADSLLSEPPGKSKGRETRDQIANIHWIIEKAGKFQKKHLLLLHWLCESLWLYRSQQTVESSSRDGNTKPPYLTPEKPVYKSRSNCYNWTWNNELVPNWERSTSRLYIVTLLI